MDDGSLITLAKGNRSKQVTAACKNNGGFYLGNLALQAFLCLFPRALQRIHRTRIQIRPKVSSAQFPRTETLSLVTSPWCFAFHFPHLNTPLSNLLSVRPSVSCCLLAFFVLGCFRLHRRACGNSRAEQHQEGAPPHPTSLKPAISHTHSHAISRTVSCKLSHYCNQARRGTSNHRQAAALVHDSVWLTAPQTAAGFISLPLWRLRRRPAGMRFECATWRCLRVAVAAGRGARVPRVGDGGRVGLPLPCDGSWHSDSCMLHVAASTTMASRLPLLASPCPSAARAIF